MEARASFQIQAQDTIVHISCLAKSIKHTFFFPWTVEVFCVVSIKTPASARRRQMRFWIWDYNCHEEPTYEQLKADADEHLRWFLCLLRDALEEKTDVLSRILARADIHYAHDIKPSLETLYSLSTAGDIAKGVAMALDAILCALSKTSDRKQLIKTLAICKPNQKVSLNEDIAKEAMVYGQVC